MPFDPVDPRQSFPTLERGILTYWREEDMFRRSISLRSGHGTGERRDGGADTYSFYDGPPFATGLPHYGHLLAGTIKDVIPRYQTMRGKQVQRRFGWDCHGLPIENLIEKEHGIRNKRQIEEMGVGKFNALCRASVQRYVKEWRAVVERMGRWVDMDYDYRTMDPNYMESIWWVFKSLFDKKLIYEGHKPMHICPRCATPLSNFEVTQGYKEVTDHSVTAKFLLEDSAYFLAWTTTPWTLPGNLFLAVHPDIPYVRVESEGALYIVAKALVDRAFKDRPHAIVGRAVKGKSLVGLRYEPLFPYFAQEYQAKAFRVVLGDFVTTQDGTGIVHIAPGFGEDDFGVLKQLNEQRATSNEQPIPLLQHVTMEGTFMNAVTDFAGMDVKPKDDPSRTDRAVATWLKDHGKLFTEESVRHSYPHCWRCDSPLLNYATFSWFVAVEKIKERMLTNAATTRWVPAHLRNGRFGKWLENARDWAISRMRYWGTPLPIWRNPGNGALEVISGRDDLMAHQLIRFTKVTLLRHGESEGNTIPVYQGTPPGTSLTARGREQVQAAAAFLKDSDIAVIYTSPLARTRETAQIIANSCNARVVVDERLREVLFGEYEGKTIDFSDLTLVCARRAKKLEDSTPESVYHFPGMEPWTQVQQRVADFLRDTLPRHRSEHVVIVTHADPIMNMRHFFTKEDPMKLSHQPYPDYATPESFFWDHDTGAELDLHRETVDGITWPGARSKDSVELTLVRHGETEWNRAQLNQGQEKDIPLNERGMEQARALAKKLKKRTFDGIITSDLTRAKQTAGILAASLKLPIMLETPLLRERKMGKTVGQTYAEIIQRYIPVYPDGDLAMVQGAIEDGEDLSQFLGRARDIQRFLLQKFPGKRLLVVSHGGMLHALCAVVDNLSYADVASSEMENCSTIELTLHPLLRRIPDVLDCWFESGSMPYAQPHHPFEASSSQLPPGFPADFIAEGVDQTRLWFYTLMVLSTILFDDAPYRNVVVNGIVLAEDGKKMSKRLRNYPDPTDVIEKYGADALRLMLMSSPAVKAEDLRFSGKAVEETLRSVLLPLWNSYSFFVTYANAARFEPVPARTSSPHPLDRMIRAQLQDLVNRMTEQLDHYDMSATCAELHDTIDVLTNWYIRLSRRRFAGKAGLDAPEAHVEDHETDRQQALTTLYDVLITLSQLLAPFCPFVTEAIYLNLVPKEHSSIHLTDWPQPRRLAPEEQTLLKKMRVLRTVVSLGMKVRAQQHVTLRQPLAKAIVAVPPTMAIEAELSDEDRALLRQELNVKELVFTENPGELGGRIVQVNARAAGPRLGARVQDVIAAGKRGEFTENPDGSILILEELLTPEEAVVAYEGHEGQGIAAAQGIVVSLNTRLTADLEQEGAARDLIRAIQKLRKEQGYALGDRVTVGISGADATLLDRFGALIAQEANVVIGPVDGPRHPVTVGGREITITMPPKISA